MKLRQKLAAVLAATMMVASVPAVTMASSENTLTHGVIVEKKDTPITAGGLKIKMEDSVDTTGSMFFVNVANAEWNISGTQTITQGNLDIEYKANNKKELQVSVKSNDGNAAKETFTLPLAVKLTGGDATVAIDGNATVVSDMAPVVFARTSETKANVTADDAVSIYESGSVADITVEESLKGTLTSNTSAADRTIKLTLKNSDFDFTQTTDQIKAAIKLSKGFTDAMLADITVAYGNAGSDKQVIEVTLPQTAATALTAPGRIEFEGLKVKAKKPSLGAVDIEVSGNKVNKTTVKVAEVKAFGNTIEMKDGKTVEVVSGKQKDITFSINEVVNDSILENRQVEVTLDKGYFTKSNADGQTLSPTVKVNDTALSAEQVTAMNITPVTDADDYVTGFTFTTPALDNVDADEITFEDMAVFVPLTVTGDITIAAEGRALSEAVSTVAITAKAPVEVTTEAMTLKVGLKDQKGGKITIKETDKEMLAGKKIEIALPKENGLTFASTKPVVKVVEGDLVLGNWEIKDGKLIIEVKRTSNTASTLEITDLVVSTDRTVPQGTYDISIKGEALVKEADLIMDDQASTPVADANKNTIKVKDFIVVGTPNTEDLAQNGLKKGISVFTIGDKSYTVNGVKQEMDASPYISNGRTMVPLRFVANALGIDSSDIFFANNVVTVIAGNKTISLEIGSNVVKLNGTPVRVMETAPVISNERTFIPVSEIGAILGVDATWDGDAKTATFENK